MNHVHTWAFIFFTTWIATIRSFLVAYSLLSTFHLSDLSGISIRESKGFCLSYFRFPVLTFVQILSFTGSVFYSNRPPPRLELFLYVHICPASLIPCSLKWAPVCRAWCQIPLQRDKSSHVPHGKWRRSAEPLRPPVKEKLPFIQLSFLAWKRILT